MPKSLYETVREVCLWLPEAEEVISHGFPDFRVRGRSFASYSVNHHGDGRVALLLNAPAGSQDYHVKSEPKHFFISQHVTLVFEEIDPFKRRKEQENVERARGLIFAWLSLSKIQNYSTLVWR